MANKLSEASTWFFGITVAFIICVKVLLLFDIVSKPSLAFVTVCMCTVATFSFLSLICDWIAAFMRR